MCHMQCDHTPLVHRSNIHYFLNLFLILFYLYIFKVQYK